VCAYFQECRTEEKYKTNEKEKREMVRKQFRTSEYAYSFEYLQSDGHTACRVGLESEVEE
jgi:hypothetical protein